MPTLVRFHLASFFGDAENVQRLCADTTVFIAFSRRRKRMHFHLDPLSKAFSHRCSFVENAQRFSVDRKPKRIEVCAVLNENALVWTGPWNINYKYI